MRLKYMNIYSDNHIQKIKEITKKYEASNIHEPIFHLLSTLLCIVIIIASLHYSKCINGWFVGLVLLLS